MSYTQEIFGEMRNLLWKRQGRCNSAAQSSIKMIIFIRKTENFVKSRAWRQFLFDVILKRYDIGLKKMEEKAESDESWEIFRYGWP